MAITLYEGFNHPTGFCGYRVVAYDGPKQMQKYFAFSKHGRTKARTMAIAFQKNYIGKRVLKGNRWCSTRRQTTLELPENMNIVWQKSKSKNHEYRYPCITVSNYKSGKGPKLFNIFTMGYNYAWICAVAKYSVTHKLSHIEEDRVYESKPAVKDVLNLLVYKAKKLNLDIEREEIYKILTTKTSVNPKQEFENEEGDNSALEFWKSRI